MRRFGYRLALAILCCAQLSSVANAADPRYPDWPCAQAKVPDISVAAVWDGPPVEDVANGWRSELEVKDLVSQLAARRTPMEEAQKSIADFLTVDEPMRAKRGTLLFAGLFETLNGQRSEIMNGLERLARREKALAEQIRSDTTDLYELQDKSPGDHTRIDELITRVQWNTRIFEERRQSIRYACEIPIIIERRLFALSRAIQQAMEQ